MRRRVGCEQGIIYWIGAWIGPIKIGITYQGVPERLATLQTGSPFELKVYGTVAGDYTLERTLHKQLAGFCHHGEWFERQKALDALKRLS